MTGRVHVVGSLNLDVVSRVRTLPAPGETVQATATSRGCGGKGANQAVAAARAGAGTTMGGAVGVDDDGATLLAALDDAGVDTRGVRRLDDTPTGRALITVQDSGENTIVVVGGANAALTDDDVDAALGVADPGPGDVLLLQLEIPVDRVRRAVVDARGATVVLNAAPAAELPADLLAAVDVLLVNETELVALAGGAGRGTDAAGTGADDDAALTTAARTLSRRHGHAVVLSRGARGALVVADGTTTEVPAPSVTAVDTTGAGDTLAGYLAAALCAGADLLDAVRHAVVAGSLAVTRDGAQSAVPHAEEVRRLVGTGTLTPQP